MWLSVFGPDMTADGFGEFPYEVQDPESAKIVTLASMADFWSIAVTWHGHWYEYAVLMVAPWRLVDRAAQLMLQRYHYSQEFHVAPYPGSYSDQPAVWVDAVDVITREIAAAQAAQQRRSRGNA